MNNPIMSQFRCRHVAQTCLMHVCVTHMCVCVYAFLFFCAADLWSVIPVSHVNMCVRFQHTCVSDLLLHDSFQHLTAAIVFL